MIIAYVVYFLLVAVSVHEELGSVSSMGRYLRRVFLLAPIVELVVLIVQVSINGSPRD